MILADKIMTLRKKAGWSQEELAEQLNVTRQSVSKWEGAQSIPDLDKILQMSRLFGVTTDYLLKDEIEDKPISAGSLETGLRRVTMEEASTYLALREAAAPKMALATFLCIISPITLILLGAMSEAASFPISEDAAAGIGLCVLLGLVTVGVGIFISCASKVKDFEFLEEEPFETEYGVSGMVKERKKAFSEKYSHLNIIGTALCILSAVPIFAMMCLNVPDTAYAAALGFLLLMVGIGCVAFVYGGTYQGAMEKLLEEGEYARSKKAAKHLKSTVSVIYWLVVTAVFMYYTFGPSGNGKAQYSWFIWAIAGVLYGAVMAAAGLLQRSGKHS